MRSAPISRDRVERSVEPGHEGIGCVSHRGARIDRCFISGACDRVQHARHGHDRRRHLDDRLGSGVDPRLELVVGDGFVDRQRVERTRRLPGHVGSAANQVVTDRGNELFDGLGELRRRHQAPSWVVDGVVGSGMGRSKTSRAVRQRHHSAPRRRSDQASGLVSSTGTLYGRSPPNMTRSGPSMRTILPDVASNAPGRLEVDVLADLGGDDRFLGIDGEPARGRG